MSDPSPTRRRWPWWVAGTLAVLVVAAVAIAVIVLRNETSELSIPEAIDAYREVDDASGVSDEVRASIAELPEPGVYAYATSGQAEVDALTGATHRYPERTTLTVTRASCGARLRWVGVKERWEERTVCPATGGLGLKEVRTFREFFGQGDERTYTCDEGAMELPSHAEGRFVATCESGGTDKSGATEIRFTGTVLGTEPVTVAGETLEAVRVSIVGTFTGATTGEQATERWLLPGGLVAREERRQRTVSDSVVGAVTYQERYELELTSTEPRR